MRNGKPLIERVVTVSGGAISSLRNLRVLIGTPVDDLLAYCNGFDSEPARLISGGPMMGQPLSGTRVPIVKGSNGILALTSEEATGGAVTPFIRCASCVRACPCGLVPLEMDNFARAGDLEGAVGYGLLDCIACGSCAYLCRSNIPLVHYFNYAKGELTARQRAEHKQKETARLAEQRNERLEKQKQAKREALAPRKQAAKAQQQTRTGAGA
jgi:electron transport complex protein RnfC